jgi:hypothetical protein
MEHYKNLDLESITYFDDEGNEQVEQWKDIPGYELSYQSSDLGRIKSLAKVVKHCRGGEKRNKERILKQSICVKTYLGVGLSNLGVVRTFLVQILVAMAFLDHVPCKNVLLVDHIDNIPLNNKLRNLQVITQRLNNTKDRKNSSSKLTGVFYRAKYNHWRVSIKKLGLSIEIGTFKDENVAGLAYAIALENIDKFNGNNKEFRSLVKSLL